MLQTQVFKTASLKQVTAATFIGGVLAGGGLLSYQLFRRGEKRVSIGILLCSLLILAFVISLPIPPSLNVAYGLAQAWLMRRIAMGLITRGLLAEPQEEEQMPWVSVWAISLPALLLTASLIFAVISLK